MESRTVNQRLDDLEADNNTLRMMLAQIQTENVRLSMQWETMAKRINKLCANVDEFVGRFQRVN